MMHAMLRLLATQPHLLADHAEAYVDLFNAEWGKASALWKKRALLNGVALGCLGVAATLAGVALMLWAVIPATQIEAPWALIVAPLLPAGVALICLMEARAGRAEGAFDKVQQQVKADLLMLREASAP